MKIQEIEQETKKCTTFIDWIKLEKKFKVLDFHMKYFLKLHGQIKEKKRKIIMTFNFRDNQYAFFITNCYMDFKVDDILIGRMSFLQDYRYKVVSTRDIYGFINLIAYRVIESFNSNPDYDQLIKCALSFGKNIKDISIKNIKELDEFLNYGDVKLDFLIFSFIEKTPFYRIRKNINHNEISTIKQCLAPPTDFVENQERFNQRHESILYGSLFFANPCFQETGLNLNDSYILVKGVLAQKLELTALINPGLEYFTQNKKDFIINLFNIFKMNVIENLAQLTLQEQENIYDLTNYLKMYANKQKKWDGFLYYSTKNKINYNVALNKNDMVKVEKVYEGTTLNDLDEYNQIVNASFEAVVKDGYKLCWSKAKENQLDLLTNFPSTDYLNNVQYYLNKELRDIEISKGDPIEYDEKGRRL